MKSTIFFKNTTPELILAFLFSASIDIVDWIVKTFWYFEIQSTNPVHSSILRSNSYTGKSRGL